MEQDKGRPLPKFGEWDVNDPASAEGFTVIFNKARDEKKTGGKPGSPGKSTEGHAKSGGGGGGGDPSKPQPVSFFLFFVSLLFIDPSSHNTVSLVSEKMALLHAISCCGLLIGTKMDLFAARKKRESRCLDI